MLIGIEQASLNLLLQENDEETLVSCWLLKNENYYGLLAYPRNGILIIQKATHGIHGMQLMNLYPPVQEQVPLFLDGINLIMMVTYGLQEK